MAGAREADQTVSFVSPSSVDNATYGQRPRLVWSTHGLHHDTHHSVRSGIPPTGFFTRRYVRCFLSRPILSASFFPSWLRLFVPSFRPYVAHSLGPCRIGDSLWQKSRSPFARAGIASARFSSTVPKQSTLKERLAELIPAEIENVCVLF